MLRLHLSDHLSDPNRYWSKATFDALQMIDKAAKAEGLTMPEIAFRWLTHHSAMSKEYGDSILIGASKLEHVEEVDTQNFLHHIRYCQTDCMLEFIRY